MAKIIGICWNQFVNQILFLKVCVLLLLLVSINWVAAKEENDSAAKGEQGVEAATDTPPKRMVNTYEIWCTNDG